MITERIKHREISLARLLKNPAWSAEFFFIDDANRPFKLWDFQYALFNKRHQKELLFCARKVSKTTTIIARLYSFCFRRPGRRAFLTSAESFHLETITSELEKQIHNSYCHRNFLKIKFKPYFQAKAKNGALIFTRVPQKKGTGLKSIHADEVYADEYQDFTEKAKAELAEVFQSDGHRLLAGVPDGTSLRLIRLISGDTDYKITQLPRMWNPTWNDRVRKDKIDEYGSEDDPDYRRNIYGEFPEEIRAVFPKRSLYLCVDKDPESFLNKFFQIKKLYASRAPVSQISFKNPFAEHNFLYEFGLDLGWGTVAPTVVNIFGFSQEEEKRYYLAYYQLFGYKTHDLEALYKYLTSLYKPHIVGIDASGGGSTLFSVLNRVYPAIDIDVTKKVSVGKVKNIDGKLVDKLVYINDLTVDLLKDAIINKEVVLPNNKDVFLEWSSFSRTESNNRFIYTKSLHGVDATRALMGAVYFSKFRKFSEKKVITAQSFEF